MKRVLVVDDELSIVKLLSFNLEKKGMPSLLLRMEKKAMSWP